MVCRECGCGDLTAWCVAVRGETVYACWWSEPDLCSFCALRLPGEERIPVRGVDDILTAGGIL